MKMTAAVLEAILAAIVDTGAVFDPADTYVGVATAIDDQGQATAQSDVTYALGGAATRVLVTAWSDPYPLNDGRWAVDGPIAAFALTGADVNQIITNWTLSDAATAGVLKSWGVLNNPIELIADGAPLSIVVRITLDPDGRWDASIIWNG